MGEKVISIFPHYEGFLLIGRLLSRLDPSNIVIEIYSSPAALVFMLVILMSDRNILSNSTN